MIASQAIRQAASCIDVNTISYEDLTNAIGETRLILARLSIEKEIRLNAKAKETAQEMHNEEQKSRDDFDAHVRQVMERKG
jgi:hypothetical protein